MALCALATAGYNESTAAKTTNAFNDLGSISDLLRCPATRGHRLSTVASPRTRRQYESRWSTSPDRMNRDDAKNSGGIRRVWWSPVYQMSIGKTGVLQPPHRACRQIPEKWIASENGGTNPKRCLGRIG